MTGNELLTNLGLRLEDPAQSIFTQANKLDALNGAQRSIVSLIDNYYLGELETIANNKVAGAGSRWSTCTFSTAFGSALPIRNGIIRIFDETNDKWCDMFSARSVKDLDNSYYVGTAKNPLAMVFDETIYIQPTSCVLIDVWYLVAPTDLAADSTECVLNIALQDILLDLAEANLWRMDGKADRAGVAQSSAINVITALNTRKGQ